MVLAFAGLVDVGLREVLGVDLRNDRWLRFTVLFGLPGLVVLAQLFLEGKAARDKARLKRLAVTPAAVPAGYFRIGPYGSSPDDRKAFRRADQAELRVQCWLEAQEGAPLYLTGQSGCGKSSLLQAAVLPSLQQAGWTIIEARAWEDPLAALAKALRPGRPPKTQPPLRDQIEAAAKRASPGLLIVLDQFEEFLLLKDEAQRRAFAEFLNDLHARPIPRLRVLLAFRSDYLSALEDLGLPPLRQGENWQEVGAFSRTAAEKFMESSRLGLETGALETLLTSAARLDDLAGLVRPVTLNVIGHVLSEGGARAASLDAGTLVRGYIAQTVGAPGIRDQSPAVLEHLLTDQATKRPRSEEELCKESGLRRGEVRAVLNALAAAGLARVLDPSRAMWELSHDFIARVVARHLGSARRDRLRQWGRNAAPALLITSLAFLGMVAVWERGAEDRAIRELAALGLSASDERGEEGGLRLDGTRRLNDARLQEAARPLQRIAHRVQTVSLWGAHVHDLAPLAALTALQHLDLSDTWVTDLTPLAGLTALQYLDLSDTWVTDLTPLDGLTALQGLILYGTQVTDLTPLAGLRALQGLNLIGTQVADLTPLAGLTALQGLILVGTPVTDLTPLAGLTALQRLDLSRTQVADLTPLAGLTALQSLNLSGTRVTDLRPLAGLTALQHLDLTGTPVTDLTPLDGLSALRTLIPPSGRLR
jgi:energy-coupling factor transporter ATP-binding protein EcfA2